MRSGRGIACGSTAAAERPLYRGTRERTGPHGGGSLRTYCPCVSSNLPFVTSSSCLFILLSFCLLVHPSLVSRLHYFKPPRLLSACLSFACHFVTSSLHLLISCPTVTLFLILLSLCCLSLFLSSIVPIVSRHLISRYLVFYHLIAHHLVRSFFCHLVCLSPHPLVTSSSCPLAPCPLIACLLGSCPYCLTLL